MICCNRSHILFSSDTRSQTLLYDKGDWLLFTKKNLWPNPPGLLLVLMVSKNFQHWIWPETYCARSIDFRRARFGGHPPHASHWNRIGRDALTDPERWKAVEHGTHLRKCTLPVYSEPPCVKSSTNHSLESTIQRVLSEPEIWDLLSYGSFFIAFIVPW